MKKKFIEISLSKENSIWALSGNHIFLIYTEFLKAKGETEFQEELDEMTEALLTLGAKINRFIGQDSQIRLVEEEYHCLIFAIQYCSCLLLIDEGEKWFEEGYFPKYGLETQRKINAKDFQAGYLHFSESFLAKKPVLPEFIKIKKEVSARMDELFPFEN